MNTSAAGQKILLIDSLRGAASFYVLVFHARWLLWEGYFDGFLKYRDQYDFFSGLIAQSFLAFSFGHQVVMLFFVISGFVIHLRYAQAICEDNSTASLHWTQYMYRRMKRLYPPLLFALLLTFIVDQIGIRNLFPVYSAPTILNLDIHPDYGIETLVGNLLFLNPTLVPSWGTNGVLWSLSYEWWFYMLYPLLWLVTKRSIAFSTVIVIVCFFVSFVPQTGVLALVATVFSGLLTWWLGALLADVYVGRIQIPMLLLSPLSALLVVLAPLHVLFPAQGPAWVAINDVFWGLGFVGLISLGFGLQNRRLGRWLSPLYVFRRIAPYSYTLYVTHFPLLIVLAGWLMAPSAGEKLPREVWWVFVGTAICMVVAYVAHFITELPFVAPKHN